MLGWHSRTAGFEVDDEPEARVGFGYRRGLKQLDSMDHIVGAGEL